MATAPIVAQMSVEEYLDTVFRPDVDYVDGFIEERNLGEWDHGTLSAAITRLLEDREQEWGIRVCPEVRVQIAGRRFRVPDVCVADARYPVEQIVRRAPLLCVEVVSPKDRLPRLLKRVQDFHRIGVERVWVFDPGTGKVWVSSANGAIEHSGGELSVPGTKIAFEPADAFARAARRAGSKLNSRR